MAAKPSSSPQFTGSSSASLDSQTKFGNVIIGGGSYVVWVVVAVAALVIFGVVYWFKSNAKK